MRRILALAIVVVAAGVFAAAAAACHSEITATMNCNGTITWTAAAWNASYATTPGRTNPDVGVWVSYDNGTTYRMIAEDHFGSDNGFAFSGSFSAGTATSALLRVDELAKWGTGDAPAAPNFVSVSRPSGCSAAPPQQPPVQPPAQPSPQPPPVQPVHAPAGPPAPPASISIVKLERVGTSGDFVPGPLTVKVGDTVEYQITVTNKGTADASVNLSDTLCGSLAPSGPQAVVAGASLTYTCSHLVVATDAPAYTNTATATATGANPTPMTVSSSVVANVTTSGVLGATTTVTKKAPATKAKTHAKAKKTKVKKVTKRAKHAVAHVKSAGFTG